MCPSCAHGWSPDFCDKKFTKKFMKTIYKQSRMDLLFNAEKIKFADTMVDTNNMIKSETYIEKIKTSNDELAALKKIYQRKLQKKKAEILELKEIKEELKKPNYKKSGFTTKCPKQNCEGFLNINYNCVLCNSHTCKDCMEIMSGEHKCDPDTVETCKFIHKESKQCPGCSESISKINGCDQMWCTTCHITFDWNTGKIDYGNNHNPHFIDWKRNSGITILRQPGEILCGGLPDGQTIWDMFSISNIAHTKWIKENKKHNKILCFDKIPLIKHKNSLYYCNFPIFKNTRNQMRFFHWYNKLRENVDFFRRRVLDYYRQECNKDDVTRELRIKYIRKQIDEKNFKKQLFALTKKKEKNLEILHVFELCYIVTVEQYNEIYTNMRKMADDPCNYYKNDYYNLIEIEHGKCVTYTNFKNYRMNMHVKYSKRIDTCIQNIQNILIYCNNILCDISIKYKNATSFINHQYMIESGDASEYLRSRRYVLQTTPRTIWVHSKSKDWKLWEMDIVPVNELFYENSFENAITIKKDCSFVKKIIAIAIPPVHNFV
tara:strand:+ start:7169 stop:8806 length:1638 start_codon:yes stop_codon:yes gene_type:complete